MIYLFHCYYTAFKNRAIQILNTAISLPHSGHRNKSKSTWFPCPRINHKMNIHHLDKLTKDDTFITKRIRTSKSITKHNYKFQSEVHEMRMISYKLKKKKKKERKRKCDPGIPFPRPQSASQVLSWWYGVIAQSHTGYYQDSPHQDSYKSNTENWDENGATHIL